MARGDRSIRAFGSVVVPVTLVAVAIALAAWPVTPGLAAAPVRLQVEVSSGAHGLLPQAARLTYRIRVANSGTVASEGVKLEQQLPPGVVPLGSPALGDGSAEGCLVFGSAGPDGASRFRASCDVGTLAPGGGAVMVVRARVDRATCGALATTVTAAEDGVRRATAAHEDRVACTCGVRLSREVTRAGAVGSDATLRLAVRNPGPHPLRYDLSGAGHRLDTGILPSGGIRQLHHTVRLTGPRTVERIVVRARAPDGHTCRAAGTVVIAAPTPDPAVGGDGLTGGGTAFTGSPGVLPVAGALVFLLLGVASLTAARRRD
jgi:hypothetical protein